MEKMKILIVDDVCFDSTHCTVAKTEFEYLQKQGHTVFLYAWGNPEDYDNKNFIVSKEPKEYFKRKFIKFFGSRKMRLHFKHTLDTLKPDVIHIHLVSNYPLAIYPVLKGYPVVHTLHGTNLFCPISWGCVKNNGAPCRLGVGIKCLTNRCCSPANYILLFLLWKRIERYIKKYITVFHCPSRNIYKSTWTLGYNNLCFFPLGIDSLFQSDAPVVKEQKPTILFAGSISDAKGIKYLLDSFLVVQKHLPNAQLLLAGRGRTCLMLKVL